MHFVAGTTARTAAALVGVNKTTAAYYFHRLRELIYEAEEEHIPSAVKSRWMRATSAEDQGDTKQRGQGESPCIWALEAWRGSTRR